jgi:hypothetical protein
VKSFRKEEQEKYLNSKLIAEPEKFISKSKKEELQLGAPEDNGMPPISLDNAFELGKEKIGANELSDEEGDHHPTGHKLDKQYKDLIDEYNPKKLAEKAQQRFKAHLPEETASQLIKGLQS